MSRTVLTLPDLPATVFTTAGGQITGAVAVQGANTADAAGYDEQLFLYKTASPRQVSWHQARSVLRLDQRSAIAGDVGGDGLRLMSNVYFAPDATWKIIQAGAQCSLLSLSAGSMIFSQAGDGADDSAPGWLNTFTVDSAGNTSVLTRGVGATLGLRSSADGATDYQQIVFGKGLAGNANMWRIGVNVGPTADASFQIYDDSTAASPFRLTRTTGNLGLGVIPATIGDGGNPRLLHIGRTGSASYGLLQFTTDQLGAVTTSGGITSGSTGYSNTKRHIVMAFTSDGSTTVDATGRLTIYVGSGTASGAVERLRLDSNGILSLSPAAGVSGLAVNTPSGASNPCAYFNVGAGMWIDCDPGNYPRIRTNSYLMLDPLLNYVIPTRNDVINLGSSGNRYATVFAASGAVSTSTQEAKNDLGLLDPEEALAEVLRVPVHRFTYKREPVDVSGIEDEAQRAEVEARGAEDAKYLDYERIGFMAEEATVPEGDALLLVGPDSVEPQNTAGVLMAALQAFVAETRGRLAALEGAPNA